MLYRPGARLVLFPLVCVLALFVEEASAKTKFVNLSDENVYIAKAEFQRGSGGRPDGWRYRGWWKIEPGEVWQSDAGPYYLQRPNRRSVRWRSLRDRTGLVRHGKRFRVFVPTGDNVAFRRLARGPYMSVQYQQFGNGLYTISGNAYEIAQRTFRFDLSSRDIKFHLKTYRVPGEVISLSRNAQSRWAQMSWTIGKRSVSLTGSTEGRQTRPFAGREKGYYRGSVTIRYVRKR